MKAAAALLMLMLCCTQAAAVPPVPPPTPVPLSDPSVNARYTALSAKFEAAVAGSANALADARGTLGRIGNAPIGSPQWREARAGALRLVELRRRDRAIFEEIRAFAWQVRDRTSDADKARLEREIAWRSQFFNSTEANVSDVLTRLVDRN